MELPPKWQAGRLYIQTLKTTVPGDAGNRRFCLLGSIPSPLNRPLRWSGYGSASLTDFENAVSCHGTVCDYAGKPASPFSKNLRQGREKKCRNGAQPQNEILRKGVWGRCHQQAKTAFRWSRWKAVLSLCGNKDTACQVAKNKF